MISYWKWLFQGSGAGPGIRRYGDRWIFLHIFVGLALSWILPINMMDAARSLLLPLAGVLIGLSFAWGGNAQALLEAPEIRQLVKKRAGGFEEYVYTYQSAILFLLITLILWGLAGFGVFDKKWPKPFENELYYFVSSVLFFFASLSVRECWHVVLGAQWFLLARHKIRDENDNKNNE